MAIKKIRPKQRDYCLNPFSGSFCWISVRLRSVHPDRQSHRAARGAPTQPLEGIQACPDRLKNLFLQTLLGQFTHLQPCPIQASIHALYLIYIFILLILFARRSFFPCMFLAISPNRASLNADRSRKLSTLCSYHVHLFLLPASLELALYRLLLLS